MSLTDTRGPNPYATQAVYDLLAVIGKDGWMSPTEPPNSDRVVQIAWDDMSFSQNSLAFYDGLAEIPDSGMRFWWGSPPGRGFYQIKDAAYVGAWREVPTPPVVPEADSVHHKRVFDTLLDHGFADIEETDAETLANALIEAIERIDSERIRRTQTYLAREQKVTALQKDIARHRADQAFSAREVDKKVEELMSLLS